MSWWTVGVSLIVAVLGSGGIVSLLKWRSDTRLGVRQQDTADDAALDARWSAIIETQTKVLLEPLQKQVNEQGLEIRELKTQLAEKTDRYWKAIQHIRRTSDWIRLHVPNAVTPPPELPPSIANDV